MSVVLNNSEDLISPGPSSETAIKFARHIAQSFGDVWEDDPDLMTRFFPVTEHVRHTFSKMQSRRSKPYLDDHWVGIKSNPTKLSQLYTPLNNLINNIIRAFDLEADEDGNRRRCINTSRSKVFPQPFPILWPSLLLAGSGKHFVNSPASRPLGDYSLAISPVEVWIEDNTNQDAEKKAVEDSQNKLTTYVRDIFANQFNRRFVFGIVLSQKTVSICLFDRSGILRSSPLEYHKYPERFCALVAGLTSLNPTEIGLDATMFVDALEQGYIRTTEIMGRSKLKHTNYILKRRLHFSSFPVGRGTMCFAAKDPTDKAITYVIKDSWMDIDLDGKESEASLLAHAKACGVTTGIPSFRHFEEIRVKDSWQTWRADRILFNRRLPPKLSATNDRLHTRTVMTPFGKPLLEFASRQEFLIAYRDAFKGMYWPYT